MAFPVIESGFTIGVKSRGTSVPAASGLPATFGGMVVLGSLGAGVAGVGAPPAGRTSCTGASCAGVQEVRG